MFSKLNDISNNKRAFNSKNSKGFSLLELVIVIVLAAVLMAVVFNMTVGGVKNGELAEDLSDVSVLVSSKTSKIFNNTLDHYSKKPEDLDIIYTEIIDDLQSKKSTL